MDTVQGVRLDSSLANGANFVVMPPDMPIETRTATCLPIIPCITNLHIQPRMQWILKTISLFEISIIQTKLPTVQSGRFASWIGLYTRLLQVRDH
jgi:hypothetical protein